MKIELTYFCIAFAIGILLSYLTSPRAKVIMKFPNPTNSHKLNYIDDNNVCYKYNSEEVDCPIYPNSENIENF